MKLIFTIEYDDPADCLMDAAAIVGEVEAHVKHKLEPNEKYPQFQYSSPVRLLSWEAIEGDF